MTERLNYMENTEERCKEEMHVANQKAGQVTLTKVYHNELFRIPSYTQAIIAQLGFKIAFVGMLFTNAIVNNKRLTKQIVKACQLC